MTKILFLIVLALVFAFPAQSARNSGASCESYRGQLNRVEAKLKQKQSSKKIDQLRQAKKEIRNSMREARCRR